MEGMIGEIRLFGGNFAPRAWALCEGQLLPIAQNTALFSIIGTIYGGDGRTTFALPDLRGRTAIGAGNGPGLSDRRLGTKGGSETNTLNITQIPSHNHTVSIQVGKEGLGAPVTNVAAGHYLGNGVDNMYRSAPGTGSLAGGTSGNTGNNQSVNNMKPWLGVYYVICLQGVFPSRS